MEIIYRKKLKKEFLKSIEKTVRNFQKKYPGEKPAILFSGGVDSTLIAYTLKMKGIDFTCYTAALQDKSLETSRDLVSARKVAKKYGFTLKEATLNITDMEDKLKKVIKIINSTSVIKVGVAMPMYLCIKNSVSDKHSGVFSGLGSEEIFAGYQRHENAENINEECKRGLKEIKERDLDRDNSIAKHVGAEIFLPFLERNLVKTSLAIPGKYKIRGEHKKLILRKVAIELGIGKKEAMRKKMGAQYGSKFDRGIQKLAKKKGFKYKSEYLKSLY
ncbi:MAG: asparagine synthase C-terminal domain-containing protein [Nanobdellota archaeon]